MKWTVTLNKITLSLRIKDMRSVNISSYLSCCLGDPSAGRRDSGPATWQEQCFIVHSNFTQKPITGQLYILTCCRLYMFHPSSVITHNIYMLQARQHLDFPEDLQQNQIIQSLLSYSSVASKGSINKTLMAHLHAVILWHFFDENFLHSVILSIQFVHNLQRGCDK